MYTTIQKLGVSKIFFLWIKEMNTFVQQGSIKLIKSEQKSFYIVTKNNIQNKYCSFELSIH